MCFKLLSLWIQSYRATIQMKLIEQDFPVVLFIMLYKVVLTFKFIDKILQCDHSNESHCAVLSCGAVYYAVETGNAVQSGNAVQTGNAVQSSNHSRFFKWMPLSSIFLWYCSNFWVWITSYLLTIQMKAVISYGAVCFSVFYERNVVFFLNFNFWKLLAVKGFVLHDIMRAEYTLV